jgi:RNA polymerase sigma-70 factor (ECF subfamily)
MAQDYTSDPDAQLMMRVSKGDAAAFEALVLKYQKVVINAAYRYTGNPSVAEELAQDAFVRVYRAASTYQPQARFSTWLFTIVRNLCQNYETRIGMNDRKTDPPGQMEVASKRKNPQDQLLNREMEKRIQLAIESLPESLRLPFVFFQFSQMSYLEIASVLEISLSAVKVRIHRARLMLADKLKDYVEK